MLLEQERLEVVEYGKKLITSGLTKGTGGNISVFNREKRLLAISPSGLDYFATKPHDIVILDLDGNKIEGDRKPSSEYDMHRIFYQNRDDINAVVHTHSVYSTVLATLRIELPATNYLIALAGGPNVRCAKYASFGTYELAKCAYEAMEDRRAVLLANHGLLTGAGDLANAFNIAEEIEHCAEVHVKCLSIGTPVVLGEGEMKVMLEKFKTYGQVKK